MPRHELRFVHVLIDRAFIAAQDARAVLSPMFWSVDFGGPREYETSLARFTRSQRLALAVHWYGLEVGNGGHWQFFANPTGVVWKDALAGLESRGLTAWAAILREATARLGGDPPLEQEPREQLVDAAERGFHDLDERFFALDRRHPLLNLLTEWTRAEPDAFLFEGLIERPYPRPGQ